MPAAGSNPWAAAEGGSQYFVIDITVTLTKGTAVDHLANDRCVVSRISSSVMRRQALVARAAAFAGGVYYPAGLLSNWRWPAYDR